MAEAEITVRFWGVRGSIASAGPECGGVGGNTSCVEVRAGDERIILDGGTGLFQLGRSLRGPTRATILFSHFHWDHIQGFPLFRPAFVPTNSFVVYGPGEGDLGVEAALSRQMQPPHFPVTLDAMAARLEFRSIEPGEEIRIGRARVRAAALHHPQGCLGYRISIGDLSVVYATDTEPLPSGGLNPAVIELAENAQLLIHDAQYTEEEYHGHHGPAKKSWGHSSIDEACRTARVAGAHRLALFHHDPAHDDRCIARLAREAAVLFPGAFAAREGMVLTLATRQLADLGAPNGRARTAAVARLRGHRTARSLGAARLQHRL